MKKLLLFLLLFVSIIPAQEKGKGKISLTLNDKKIDLPITSVSLRKENHILLSIRAEENNDDNQNMISLELTLNELKAEDNNIYPEGTRIDIFTKSKYEATGEELSIHLPGNSENGTARYSVFNKGEKMNWDISSFNLKFDLKNISFSNGVLRISGSFNGNFRSTLTEDPMKSVAEVKDGEFEIVI